MSLPPYSARPPSFPLPSPTDLRNVDASVSCFSIVSNFPPLLLLSRAGIGSFLFFKYWILVGISPPSRRLVKESPSLPPRQVRTASVLHERQNLFLSSLFLKIGDHVFRCQFFNIGTFPPFSIGVRYGIGFLLFFFLVCSPPPLGRKIRHTFPLPDRPRSFVCDSPPPPPLPMRCFFFLRTCFLNPPPCSESFLFFPKDLCSGFEC